MPSPPVSSYSHRLHALVTTYRMNEEFAREIKAAFPARLATLQPGTELGAAAVVQMLVPPV